MKEAPIIGIDLGGTNMTVGLVSPEGQILGRARRKTKPEVGLEGVIERLVEAVERACTDARVPLDQVAGVGIGVPGAIDIPRGLVYEAPNLQWFDVLIRDRLVRALGRPVVVDNDVNVAVWGESRLGAGRGHGSMLGAWVGTGIGGGLVLEGKVWRGSFFTAGEIGQTVVTPDGSPSKRTLEQHASRTGMAHSIELLLRKHPGSLLHGLRRDNEGTIGTRQIAAAFASNDALAVEVVEHAADMIGVVIANVLTVLSIGAVVIGGGVTEALGQPFVDRIRRSVDRHVFPARLRAAVVKITDLREDAGVLGAALMAREELAAPERSIAAAARRADAGAMTVDVARP